MSELRLDAKGVIASCPRCGRRNRLTFGSLGRTARCAECKNPLPAPAEPIEIESSADFAALTTSSSLPVVVDFWAPWCGPCRMVAPELAKVAAANAGRLVVVKVNTEALPDLGDRFGIRSIPTMTIFAGGREVGRTVGARPAPDIEAFIRQTLAPVER